MSQELISRSPDLKRLRDEGYEVEVRSNYLLVHNVPYVNSAKEVCFGTLISELTLAGNVTACPGTHVVQFTGDHPCNNDGTAIVQISHSSPNQTLADGLVAKHSFSNKPNGGYVNYYDKMTRYIEIISAPAESIDDSVTAKTFKVIEAEGDQSVFNYIDTCSSRAGISLISNKLATGKIAIVGLGGTGSYVLDLVTKTPVPEIHLFDGDRLLQHNAFRSPGAPSVEELADAPMKVDYFAKVYSEMHRRIIPHDCYIDASNIDALQVAGFLFLCLDKGEPRQLIISKLEEWEVPFIDVGMGIEIIDDQLIGILRITTSTDRARDHIRNRIPFSDDGGEDGYSQNIQTADLNALNAALAVVKWKKLCGFYGDATRENHCTYTLNVNMLLSEDNDP